MSDVDVRLGTRGSDLALTQSRQVAAALAAAGTSCELVPISTEGDRSSGPLAQIGGTGVFVTAVREALLAGSIDIAVHSLKDLPTGVAEGLIIGAVPERADPFDALCARDGFTLGALPVGATVGTGSPRRAAQLLAMRPDLRIAPIRGNVGSRLNYARTGQLDAVVLAVAGLMRLGRTKAITQRFGADHLLPAAGQGALAVECRSDDTATTRLLAPLDHAASRAAVIAERALLTRLEGGCSAPVGALATIRNGTLTLLGGVISLDGADAVRDRIAGDPADAVALGVELAERMLRSGAADLIGGRQ